MQTRKFFTASDSVKLDFSARQITIINTSLFWVYVRAGGNDIPKNTTYDYACPPASFVSFVTFPPAQNFGVGFTPNSALSTGVPQQCAIIFNDTVDPIGAAQIQSPLLSNLFLTGIQNVSLIVGNTLIQTQFVGFRFRIYKTFIVFGSTSVGSWSLSAGGMGQNPIVGHEYQFDFTEKGYLTTANQDIIFTNSMAGVVTAAVQVLFSLE